MPDPVTGHVIFVHGLGGDKDKTWRSSGNQPEFWPDWIADDMPGMAVWSLGYPAAATVWKGGIAMALPDRAENVLPTLVSEPGLQDGPITLVGHSLGGLVIVATLRRAEGQAPHDAKTAAFLRRVRRVVFLGTPFRGADIATWANWAPLSWFARPHDALRGLSRNDPHLGELITWFRGYRDTAKVSALVFRETIATPVLGSRRFGRLVVKQDSADPGLSPGTSVIPLDEDHYSIVAPSSKDAEVYRLLLSFIRQPITSDHPDARRDQQIAGMQETLVSVAETATAIKADQDGIAARLGDGLRSENSILTAEGLTRLSRLRRSRHIVGVDAEAEAERLYRSVISGELVGISREAKRTICSWCSRITASRNAELAHKMLEAANECGLGEENTVAEAVLTGFGGNKPEALSIADRIGSPTARTVAFVVSGYPDKHTDALRWLEESGLTEADLDADGKHFLIHWNIEQGYWDDASRVVASLQEVDYQSAPVLLAATAMTHLAQSVQDEGLRKSILANIPSELIGMPLGTDAQSLQYRRTARAFYSRASEAFAELDALRASHAMADFALALGLLDPSTREGSLVALQESMSDPEHRVRRIPLALACHLAIDISAAEREIDQQTALSGGRSPEAAAARFALAMKKTAPLEVARYIKEHRKQLTEVYAETYLLSIEIEALAKAGEIDDARQALKDLKGKVSSDDYKILRPKLDVVIQEYITGDTISLREKEYSSSKTLGDLIGLVIALRGTPSVEKLFTYSKQLFERTKELEYATTFAEAAFAVGKDEEIVSIFESFPELAEASDDLSAVTAWAFYRLGRLTEAKVLLDRVRANRDAGNDRHLWVNVAIASGDWSSLGAFAESEWTRRNERIGPELLRAGQLARRVGLTARAKDLIRAAAAKAEDDPVTLVGCYSAAFGAGWEGEVPVHEWMARAIELSGEDGPVKSMSLRELADMEPDWDKRQGRVVDMLINGTAPMFAAAMTLNRTLLDIFLTPALLNLDEADPRKRALVFAFSGVRPRQAVRPTKTGLDVTAILTLAMLGLLDKVLTAAKPVTIAHTCLAWLFDERERLEFHQPSRVADARQLRRLVDSGSLKQFEGPSAPPELADEVGDDLARFLTFAVNASNGSTQQLVIRSAPISKPGSLMDQVADIAGYEDQIAGCADLVIAMRDMGSVTEQRAEQALNYLRLQEKPWDHKVTIQAGATLFLDDLSVSHLQHVGLLGNLSSAGFTAFITQDQLTQADALVAHDANSDAATRIVEDIRASLARGVADGSVVLSAMPRQDDEADDTLTIREHPCSVLVEMARDVDILVIDDRFYNRHAHAVHNDEKPRPIITTVDLIEWLLASDAITKDEGQEAFTSLRRMGMVIPPLRPGEALELLTAAATSEGHVVESAELRSIREAVDRLKMTKALQLPTEGAWIGSFNQELVLALRGQWRDDIPDQDARARSSWVVGLLDPRTWTHLVQVDGREIRARYRMFISGLLIFPGESTTAQHRYWQWLEDTILADFRDEDPEEYSELISTLDEIIADGVARTAEGARTAKDAQ